ncbi:MAG: hypothetical protein K2X55_27500 [Burkholderiaceae bacterium]|nr:hypothetical protein [Burkholderiaceae bacterium]
MWRRLLPYWMLLAMLAGCARDDGTRLLGHWRAERAEVMSLMLPIAPELEITPTAMVAANQMQVPITALVQDGAAVTIETSAGIGLVFHFVEADRMYVEFPLLGRFYYRRVQAPVPLATNAVPAAPLPKQAPVTPMPAQPVVAPSPPKLNGKTLQWDTDLQQARLAMQQARHDDAIRHLHVAFEHGFRDQAALNTTKEFAAIQDDVRYQVLLARYNTK